MRGDFTGDTRPPRLSGSVRPLAGVWYERTESLIRAAVVLLAVSIYPIGLMTREVIVGNRAYAQYHLERVPTTEPDFVDDALQVDIGGHVVSLTDDLGRSQLHDARAVGVVHISIDDRDYSSPSATEIRPYFLDGNRYHGWVKLIRLVDRKTNVAVVAAAQRIAPPATSETLATIPRRSDLRYRVLLVGEKGNVTEDVFEYGNRGRPVIRAMLANYVSPFSVGFYSDVLQVWPTVLFPILYPGLTGTLGVLLLVVGLAKRSLVRKSLNAGSNSEPVA